MSTDPPAQPRLIVLAGSNGAGKSTFFTLFLEPTGIRFVNADRIARVIAPEAPEDASYTAAAAAELERRTLIATGESFCMETVFSDPAGAKLGLLRDAQAAGYRVHLVFIGIDSVELSEARVIQRVQEGGHDVPPDKLASRFPRTLGNLEAALPFVDSADLYDNADADAPYRLVARFEAGRCVARFPPIPAWAQRVLTG
jgi:predicted ABC-type ATPase